MKEFNPTAATGISAAQVSNLGISLASGNCRNLTAAWLSNLSDDAIEAWSGNCAGILRFESLENFDAFLLARIPPSTAAGFLLRQVTAIPAPAFAGLTTAQAGALALGCAGLWAAQVPYIKVESFANFTGLCVYFTHQTFWRNVSAAQFKSLSRAAIEKLSSECTY